MKKKILIGAFGLLILITSIFFIAGAIKSYNYDMDPANHIDIMAGMGAVLLIFIGGLVVLCELDIFFTVYYFLVKPKTLRKSIFMIFSQLMLLIVIFSEDLAYFLSQHVSDVFREEILVVEPIFFLYVVLRLICISICFSKKD